MRSAPKKALELASPEKIAVEIPRLSDHPISKLRAAWRAEFRRGPPKGLWRDLLLRTLAWRIQEKAFGGHDKATLKLREGHGQKRAVTVIGIDNARLDFDANNNWALGRTRLAL